MQCTDWIWSVAPAQTGRGHKLLSLLFAPCFSHEMNNSCRKTNNTAATQHFIQWVLTIFTELYLPVHNCHEYWWSPTQCHMQSQPENQWLNTLQCICNDGQQCHCIPPWLDCCNQLMNCGRRCTKQQDVSCWKCFTRSNGAYYKQLSRCFGQFSNTN